MIKGGYSNAVSHRWQQEEASHPERTICADFSSTLDEAVRAPADLALDGKLGDVAPAEKRLLLWRDGRWGAGAAGQTEEAAGAICAEKT
jgi:hypothetical protein